MLVFYSVYLEYDREFRLNRKLPRNCNPDLGCNEIVYSVKYCHCPAEGGMGRLTEYRESQETDLHLDLKYLRGKVVDDFDINPNFQK